MARVGALVTAAGSEVPRRVARRQYIPPDALFGLMLGVVLRSCHSFSLSLFAKPPVAISGATGCATVVFSGTLRSE
eukprot:11163628-Lingulodinium_polyedra.AAC.1